MEGKLGLIPDMGGTLAVRELMARDRAMWLTMTAGEFSGERALELGLVTGLAEDPANTAREMAARLIERSPDAVAAVKRLYRKSWTGSAGMALARETAYQVRIIKNRKVR
jgi:enoyl-CoA hydratase/carnithine racemase